MFEGSRMKVRYGKGVTLRWPNNVRDVTKLAVSADGPDEWEVENLYGENRERLDISHAVVSVEDGSTYLDLVVDDGVRAAA